MQCGNETGNLHEFLFSAYLNPPHINDLVYLHLSSQLCNIGCETKQLWDGNIHEVCILQHSRRCSMAKNQVATYFFLSYTTIKTKLDLFFIRTFWSTALNLLLTSLCIPHTTPTKKTQSNISLLDRHHGQLDPHFSSFYLLNQRPHQLFTCYRPHHELFRARGKCSAPVFLQSGRKFRNGKRAREKEGRKTTERCEARRGGEGTNG